MIVIRTADRSDLKAVLVFYQETEYSGGVNPTDQLIIAEHEGKIVGALRVCEEHGHLLLRGMRVRSNMRRQGIGRRMLGVADEVIGHRPCYLLAYLHLQSFYGRVGFVQVERSEAPAFLQARWASYRERGVDTVIMKRSALMLGVVSLQSAIGIWLDGRARPES